MNLIPSKLDGRDVLLGVRPEHLEPCAESEANFIAEVDLVEPLGADTLAHGKVEGTRIIARLHAALNTVQGRHAAAFPAGEPALFRRRDRRAAGHLAPRGQTPFSFRDLGSVPR